MRKFSIAKNIKKRLARILFYFLLVIISFPLVLTILFRSPLIQTLSARLLTNWVTEEMDRNISVESVRISFYSGIYLKDIKAYDHNNNPILFVNSLIAEPDFPWVNRIKFSRIDIDGAEFTYGRYKDEENFAFMDFIGVDTIKTSSNGVKFKLYSENLKLTNSSFRLFDETKSYSNGDGMDYANIQIQNINGFLRDFNIVNDSLNFEILMLTASEKSGIKINNLSSNFSISSLGLHAYNSKISTEKSNLDFDLDFNYSSYASMSMFVDSVQMQGNIRPSELDLSDLGYFAEVMHKMPNKLLISGSIVGAVNELNGDDIFIQYATKTSFNGDVYIKGLPDFYSSFIRLGIQDFKTNKCDIQHFNLPIDEKNIDIPLDINCFDNISVIGNFEGYYGNFKTELNISLPNSKLLANIDFDENKNDSIWINANLQGENLNIGKYLNIPTLSSSVSFNGDFIVKGLNINEFEYTFNTLINKVGILGYKYKRIKLDGSYSKDELKSVFRIGDKNLMASGNIFLNSENETSLIVNSDIVKANIDKLGFWSKGPLGLSTILSFNTIGLDINSMNADLLLLDSELNFGSKNYGLDTIQVTTSYDNSIGNSVIVKSDFLNAIMKGDYQISTLDNSCLDVFNHYYEATDIFTTDTLNKMAVLDFEILNGEIIEEQFVKGLKFEKGTKANLVFDFEKNLFNMSMVSNRIDYYGIEMIDNNLIVNTLNGKLDFNYTINNIVLKDSTENDKTVLGIDDFTLQSEITKNNLDFNIYWYKNDTTEQNTGIIKGSLKHDSIVETLRINEVDVFVNGVNWGIDTSNRISFNPQGVTFENLSVSAGNSKLDVEGSLYGKETDTLNIVFDKWDISYFDILTKSYNIDLDGVINGYLNIGTVGGNQTVISNVKIDALKLNNQYLGEAHILNTWDNVNKSIYFKGQLIDDSKENVDEMIDASGFYYPFRKSDALNIVFKFRNFKLPSVEPLIKSYVSEIKGLTSGEIKINGTIENPDLTGFAKMNETSLIVNYLNTRYSFSNLIVFDKDLIKFDKLVLYDTIGNNAKIKGYLKHQNFKNPWLDVNISSDKFLFFNTSQKMNELYYGTGILSGNIDITGKPNDIKLNITTSTKQGTRVFLPLDYTTVVSDKDYIIFVQTEHDSLVKANNELKNLKIIKNDKLKYEINLEMGITPTARVNIAMPSNMGDIEAQGEGDLDLKVNSAGEFELFGEYIVSKGLFNFTIENLVNKRFELVKGGRISWTGDPYTASVDLKGLYKVKANLSSLGLVIDSSSSYKNKVNVECYINLQNQLLDPTIKFEIKIPELDPDLQRAVFAELDTTNAAMMNQQMISLLVLGTFSYSNASNINLSTSYYTILTNQLSGMLSQISDDFDIGVNYKPGDDITSEEFEVALSTQLFDDRLIIDGNFGVTYDRSQQSTSNIVGDVDIAYKLTEDGRWVLKAYNHSNVNSWYYYNNYDKISPYTQGVGIAFRKEFNKLGELFKRKRKRVKKKKT